MKHLFYSISGSLFIFLLSACFQTPQKPLLSFFKMEENLLTTQLRGKQDMAFIWISKSAYTLELRVDSLVLARLPVVFGANPVKDKLKQGDKSTPEGTFSIRDMYPHKKWSKFIWIDYPTEDSWAKHRAAKAKGQIPHDAAIGGEIGIHGVPTGYDSAIDNRQNWTLGCISMRTSDINWLYEHVHTGMKVKIVP